MFLPRGLLVTPLRAVSMPGNLHQSFWLHALQNDVSSYFIIKNVGVNTYIFMLTFCNSSHSRHFENPLASKICTKDYMPNLLTHQEIENQIAEKRIATNSPRRR
jgi:hypothetical protein